MVGFLGGDLMATDLASTPLSARSSTHTPCCSLLYKMLRWSYNLCHLAQATHHNNMICKLLMVVGACAAVVMGQADKYPAGVSAALCPNYPYCDNALLALYSSAPVAPTARQYPAGVAPAACPNYPYCGTTGAVPLPYHAAVAREWPAGVAPAACPNYPYCH
ncbi:hypothetical protein B566_EDAN014768 [Ephemera danica]|nr:hypothetical protein B566_EDAN014768 [Ephemera danica]